MLQIRELTLYFIARMTLKIVTINARGLKSVYKFQTLIANSDRARILCIQETYWDNECVKKYENVRDGSMYFNNGQEKQGKGLTILIKRGVSEKERVIFKDEVGKSIAVELVKEGKKITLCNIHAPNDEKGKNVF